MTLRRIYSRSRFIEREYRGRLLRALGFRQKLWNHGLFDEFQYWERTLFGDGRNPQSEFYKERIDPAAPLQPEFRELIQASPGATVRILDVGAGPLTTIGKVWDGRKVEVTAVDALAARYDEILSRAQIVPPVRTVFAHGEKLGEVFGENSFDFAHARNSLDHAYDPMEAIRQMVRVVKPGCHVYLWHVAHVGENENYRGLHQWNFDIINGDFVIGNSKENVKVKDNVPADVTCSFVDTRVVAVLKKH